MSDNIASRALAAKPFPVSPQLPNPVLPEANWADAFEIETRRSFADMKSLAQHTIGSMPSWARRLLWVRNTLLAPFGLKRDGLNSTQGAAECVDIFPILEQSTDRIVLGLDDWHLDFRIIVDRSAVDRAFRLRATTLVKRHNVFGRLYITIITPFHRLIVQSVLKNAL